MQIQTPQKRELLANALKVVYLGVFAFVFLAVFAPALKTIFIPAVASADTSNTINFQARLQNSAGGIVPDGSYNVEFKIYDTDSSSDSSQGSCSGDSHCLWTETRTSTNKVTVVNGYMSVNLGSVTAFSGINWNQQLYLTMNVGGTGTASWDGEMNPRLKMTAVPYAFQANKLAQYNTTTGYNSTLQILQPTGGNQTFQIQDQGAGGTYNLLTQNTANANYIQNQTSGAQTASLWINGSNRADTSVLSPLFDAATAGSLSVGTSTATSVSIGKSGSSTTINGSLIVSQDATFNGNITVAAGKSLSLTGGNTASRPGSPTEGMLYYDTDTDKLLVYAGGKWQASSQNAITVAASNSSQADKDAADYVATGTSDQTVINSALTAADPAGSGRKTGRVILLAGTYTISDAISVPNNTTLAGQGTGTLIQFANLSGASKNMITNTTASGTGVTVRDLQLDGNDSVNTTGTDYGIYMNAIGTSSTPGAIITNVSVTNVLTYGIYLNNVFNTNLTANTVWSNGGGGVYVNGNKGSITNNIIFLNAGYGLTLNSSQYNDVTGNQVNTNTSGGMLLTNTSIDNNVSTNNLYNNGGGTTTEGIVVTNSDDNLITSNHITDSTCSTNCYAIDITASTSDRTFLSGNTFNGGSPTETINDQGTGTIYGGQTNSSGAYVLQASGGVSLNGATTVTGNLTVTNAGNVAYQKGSDYSTTGSQNNVDFGTGALFRLTGASTQTITGITNGADGRLITLINAASQAAVLSNNSGSSSSGNKIITGTGSDLSIAAGASVSLVYDSTSTVWRVVGTISGATSGGSYITLQGSTPGTADTGNFNISGTGIAANLQGTTSVTTPLLDTVSAGTLSIGTTTATAVSVGKSGATTTVNGSLAVSQTSTFSGDVTITNGNDLNFGGDSDHTISIGTASSGNGNSLTLSGGQGTSPSGASVVGQTITPVVNNNTVTANFPSGLQAGDVLVMTVGHAYGVTSPSGWTVLQNTGTQSNTSGGFFTKTVASGDVGGSVTLSFSNTYYGEVIIVALHNVGAVHDSATFRTGTSTSSQNVGPIDVTAGDIVVYGGFARLTGQTIGVNISHGTTLAQRSSDTSAGAVAGYEIASSTGTLSQTFSDTKTATSAYDTMISFTPAASANGGNVLLSGGGAAGGGAAGSVIVKNGTDSTTAFQIQNASGTTLLAADTSGMAVSISGGLSVTGTASAATVQGSTSVLAPLFDAISASALSIGTTNATSISIGKTSTTATVNGTLVVGSSGNTITLTSTGYTLAGTARNTKTILLAAEYPNAILDNGTLSNNSGTMTSGIDLTNRMNYYKWTTTQATNQTYDIDVQWLIPKDFDAWASNPVSVTSYTSNTTNGTIKLETRDTAGSVICNFVAVTPGSTSTWAANNTACTMSTGTYTPGSYITLRIRLQSPTSGDVRVGNIMLNYLSNK
jgi:hypothetical protein